MHKKVKNGLPPFHPILSAIGTPTYKLAKFLLSFVTSLTQNEYTITDTFNFAEEICNQDRNLYMTSRDVYSLFANIPLEEITDICIDYLYKDDENSPEIPEDVFGNFLTVAIKKSFFIFNNKFYKQIHDVPMWSPVGSALANIFMCSFENK